MRVVRKSTVTAAQEQILCEGEFDPAAFDGAEEVSTAPVEKYPEACNHILAAINSLAEVAQEDSDAREAIANLSVVLLDLKG